MVSFGINVGCYNYSWSGIFTRGKQDTARAKKIERILPEGGKL